MEFEKLFEGRSWPEVNERIGVMSVDSLDRLWVLVSEECGYLIAKSMDGTAALLGRMCRRDDGKLCIEIAVRAEIESIVLRHHEVWHANSADGSRFARRLNEVMQEHISKFQPEYD